MTKAPGPQGHYLNGHAREFDADPLSFLLEQQRCHGAFYRFRLGLQQVFVVSDIGEIQQILNARDAFTDKAQPHRMERAYHRSVARIEGADHLDRRRLLQPAFTRDALAALGDAIAVTARRCSAAWRDDEARPVFSDMKAIALESLVRALLGREGAARMPELARVIPVVEAWLGNQPLDESSFRQAEAELRSILIAVAGARRAAGSAAPDLLGCLLGGIDDGRIDHEVLVDEIAMMLMTSIPTAIAQCWVWYYLAAEPEVCARALHEVEAIAGDGPATTEHVEQLCYLGHVASEALRLHPPVWTLAREALREWPVGPYTIPAGAEVLMSPYVVHRMTEHWREPERFAPERFEPASPLYQPRPRLALMPFGAGSRKCIGERLTRMLLVLTTATVLQRYRPALPAGFQVSPSGKRPKRPGDGHPAHSTLVFSAR